MSDATNGPREHRAGRRQDPFDVDLGHALAEVAAALRAGGIGVQTDPDVLAGCATDWTGRFAGPVLAMVRPRSTDQVAAVLAAARAAGLPVQVQGGNTGLVGGSVPDRPALLLSTRALDAVGAVDPLERTVVVGAGATLGDVARHVRPAGLHPGVDLAARDSATIGGMVATNAGGIGVLAHGMMREQVRGLVAVLADGRVLRTTGRPRKDNAGYDLAGLLVGSEGTLGVVTEVELALHPIPRGSTVGLLAVPTLAAAVAAGRAVAAEGWPLLAAEVVDRAGVAQVCRLRGLPDPMGGAGSGWMLLLEVADGGSGDGLAAVGDHVRAVATTTAERERLWSYREAQAEVYATVAGPRLEKLDVAVRLDRLDDLVAEVRALVAGHATVGAFGHALDGNLHLQLVPIPGAGPGRDLAGAVLDRVVAMGGAVSAEHGIGRAKVGHLSAVRGADEVAWMRQVKAGVDPAGLLNPGVLLG